MALVDAGAELVLPGTRCDDVLSLVSFCRGLGERLRTLREETSLPRAAVTLPDEFDEVVARSMRSMHEQAEGSLAQGEEAVDLRLPWTESERALMRWSLSRTELIEGVVRAGMIGGGWQRPLDLLRRIWEHAVSGLGLERQPSGQH